MDFRVSFDYLSRVGIIEKLRAVECGETDLSASVVDGNEPVWNQVQLRCLQSSMAGPFRQKILLIALTKNDMSLFRLHSDISWS